MVGSTLLLLGLLGSVPTASSLVNRQEEALRQIHSLRATIECRVSRDEGKTWKFVYRFEISRSGSKQRFRRYFAAALRDGKYEDDRDFADFLDTEESRLSTTGIDPEHPPAEPVAIIDQERQGQRISGRIAPAAPLGPGGYMSQWMLPILFSPGMETLRELVKVTGDVTPTANRAAGGAEVWEMRLRSRAGPSFRVTIDPRYNYMISKSEMTNGKYVSSMQVVEFAQPKPGIFIPRLVRDNERNPDQLVEYTIKDLEVNEPVSEEVFAFRFPVGTPLDDDINNVVHIWGDGKPAHTFATHAEFNRWMEDQRAGAFRKTGRGLFTKFALVGGVTALLALLLYWRRRMVAARAAA